MDYDVSLRIDYRYSLPTAQGQALVRVEPLDVPGVQAVRDLRLVLDPAPTERRMFRDFFGNHVTALAWDMPVAELSLDLRFSALRTAVPPPDVSARLDRLADSIAALRSLSPDAPQHCLAPSRRVPRDAGMTAFARAALRPGMTALEAVLAIAARLHGEMRFAAGATHVDTPAAESFARREGVCQDFAHILIGCLRSIGIPAGYVSGFLRTVPPPGQPRLEGADAMHAWVRAWVGGDAGWIEIDPTNDCHVGTDHIVIGYGRDYDDIAPVRGALRGAGRQDSVQRVDVSVRG
ncbi:transglutaminase family protein [Anianabacter salinae]|uniref:transglutaminase family protein n=1 Tax=Anianabacter salinae TaxID=2851023 RepID=UPI00225DFFBA|nr:transglutaminase family protein [Anianabacter salinae]MBV0910759.1 transglutaminase family protein [Anianabacter salinae]